MPAGWFGSGSVLAVVLKSFRQGAGRLAWFRQGAGRGLRVFPAGCRQVGLVPAGCRQVGLVPAVCRQWSYRVFPAGCFGSSNVLDYNLNSHFSCDMLLEIGFLFMS